jgi:F-type H+-transporting ATPase subunit epsilon
MERAGVIGESAPLRLEVVSPDRRVLDAPADEVVLPGKLGYLGVRAGHTPLLTELGIGQLSYVYQGKTRYLSLSGGFAEVLPDRVRVLAEAAECAEEIDVERARLAQKRAQEELASRRQASEAEFLEFQVRLERAVIRIETAAKREG